jgi:hypothetical protein
MAGPKSPRDIFHSLASIPNQAESHRARKAIQRNPSRPVEHQLVSLSHQFAFRSISFFPPARNPRHEKSDSRSPSSRKCSRNTFSLCLSSLPKSKNLRSFFQDRRKSSQIVRVLLTSARKSALYSLRGSLEEEELVVVSFRVDADPTGLDFPRRRFRATSRQ